MAAYIWIYFFSKIDIYVQNHNPIANNKSLLKAYFKSVTDSKDFMVNRMNHMTPETNDDPLAIPVTTDWSVAII